METEPLSSTENEPPKLRWYRLTPGRFLGGVLAVEGVLVLLERFGWFTFNQHRGWTVLIDVAVVGVAVLILVFWWLVSLLFRWPFQFSIRSLLALTVAVAIPCSWLAVETQRARVREEVEKRVHKLGGQTWTVCNPFSLPSRLRERLHLRELFGFDFFGVADELSLDETQATDGTLEDVSRLTEIGSLELGKTQITDAGLVHLKRITDLRCLSLKSTRITDAGLEHVKGLTHLWSLDLRGTPITDAGLEHLSGLTELNELELCETKVTEQGVRRLQTALPECKIRR
jgi:hypothetical protein